MSERYVFLILLLVWLFASSVEAQVDDTHKGYWLSFGAGGGWTGTERSATSYFRMGGTPNAKVHFGGQVLHWWQSEEMQHTTVTATFAVYPFYRSRGHRSVFQEFFLKTGFGVAAAERYEDDFTGVGVNLGAGFDLRLGDNFFVTPNLDFSLNLYNDSTERSFLFSLGLSWH